MNNVKPALQKEIENVFGVQKNEITEFRKIGASNFVYSFIVKDQKYVIKKLIDTSINDWKQERDAYNALKPLNVTDELVCYNNGVKISKFLNNGKELSYEENDIIDALDLTRKVHESGISIKYDYNIIENMEKYIMLCDKKTEMLNELRSYRNKIDAIQKIVDKLNIPPVLCHGDACATTNFLRLPDGSIKMIDWEQAGMADPLLDIAIAVLHQGFENIDPVWCLHHYLKRIPEEQEYLRLYSFLALNSFALMAWCLSIGDIEGYRDYLKSAVKYSGLVLGYYLCLK
jgi:thiamine kinase-like enzyme